MLGVAGIMAAEIVKPDVSFYDAPLKTGLPINLAALLGIQFLLMHYVEVRRFMDIRKAGSVNEDPIFKGNKLPDGEMGYPGGIFNPLNFGANDMKTMKLKEIKNGRLAMISEWRERERERVCVCRWWASTSRHCISFPFPPAGFVGFIIQYQTLGLGPIAALKQHLSEPFAQNITTNLGKCVLPESVDAYGVTVATPCLWPYHG